MFKKVLILWLTINSIIIAYKGDGKEEPQQSSQETYSARLREHNPPTTAIRSLINHGKTITKLSFNKLEQCSRALESLYQHDVELKGTWSYQALTLARSVTIHTEQQLKSSTYWSFMHTLSSVMVQHYSPQIFYTVGKFIVPKALKSDYEQAVDEAFKVAHVYDIIQNPTKHVFAYACGYIGVYLIAHMLEDGNETFYEKELKGAAYFCCREAGFKLQLTHSHNLFSFIQSLPTYLYTSIFTQEEPLTIDTILLEQKKRQVKEMDDNVIVKDKDGKLTKVVLPICEKPQLRERAIKAFNDTVVPRLLNAHEEALNASLPLVVMWGQNHYSCGCYWQERELLKWVKSIGIDDFVFEVGQNRLYEWMVHTNELRSHERSLDSLSLQSELAPVARLLHARQLNYTIIPGDPYFDKELPLWDAFQTEYFAVLLAVKHRKISRNQQIKIMGYSVDLSKCPDFFGREREMASTVKETSRSMVGLYGVAHLGGIHHLLGTYKNAHVIFLSCYNSQETYTIFNRIINYFSMRGRRDLLNMVFGKGCGDNYIQAHSYANFFHVSPEIIRSGTPNDYLFDSQK